MNDKQLQKDVVMALRQVEIVKAQTELLHLSMIDLARRVGIQLIDPSQAPQPAQPKPSEKPAEKSAPKPSSSD